MTLRDFGNSILHADAGNGINPNATTAGAMLDHPVPVTMPTRFTNTGRTAGAVISPLESAGKLGRSAYEIPFVDFDGGNNGQTR